MIFTRPYERSSHLKCSAGGALLLLLLAHAAFAGGSLDDLLRGGSGPMSPAAGPALGSNKYNKLHSNNNVAAPSASAPPPSCSCCPTCKQRVAQPLENAAAAPESSPQLDAPGRPVCERRCCRLGPRGLRAHYGQRPHLLGNELRRLAWERRRTCGHSSGGLPPSRIGAPTVGPSRRHFFCAVSRSQLLAVVFAVQRFQCIVNRGRGG